MNKIWQLTWETVEFNTVAGTEFHDTFVTPFGKVIRFTYPNHEKSIYGRIKKHWTMSVLGKGLDGKEA